MRLFLYGTLQPGADTTMARWLAQRVVSAQPASAHGQLFAIPAADGWYPALMPGRGRSRGTLVRAELSRPEIARLDRYEGAEYRRSALRVLAAGTMVTCSGYLWEARLPAKAERIADGDFAGWLKRSGQRSYGSAIEVLSRKTSAPIDPRRRACHRAPPCS